VQNSLYVGFAQFSTQRNLLLSFIQGVLQALKCDFNSLFSHEL
jgi:hypothetical protein